MCFVVVFNCSMIIKNHKIFDDIQIPNKTLTKIYIGQKLIHDLKFVTGIKNTSSSYYIVDTGVPYTSTNNTYEIECEWQWENIGASGWWNPYAAYKDEASNTFRIIRYDGKSDSLLLYSNAKAGGGSAMNLNYNVFQRFKIIHNNSYIILNGNKINVYGQTLGTHIYGTINFKISFYSKMAFYGFVLRDSGKIIRNMKPCIKGNNIGMYDIIAHKFYDCGSNFIVV